MATQITQKIHEDVDWYLNAFERYARWAVDLAQRWDDIDELDQLDLIAEWPLVIDYLLRSLAYWDKGMMSQEQYQHLLKVRAFLQEHEPILAEVLGHDNLMLDPSREWYVSLGQ